MFRDCQCHRLKGCVVIAFFSDFRMSGDSSEGGRVGLSPLALAGSSIRPRTTEKDASRCIIVLHQVSRCIKVARPQLLACNPVPIRLFFRDFYFLLLKSRSAGPFP